MNAIVVKSQFVLMVHYEYLLLKKYKPFANPTRFMTIKQSDSFYMPFVQCEAKPKGKYNKVISHKWSMGVEKTIIIRPRAQSKTRKSYWRVWWCLGTAKQWSLAQKFHSSVEEEWPAKATPSEIPGFTFSVSVLCMSWMTKRNHSCSVCSCYLDCKPCSALTPPRCSQHFYSVMSRGLFSVPLLYTVGFRNTVSQYNMCHLSK